MRFPIVFVAALAIPGVAVAHHGWGTYDAAKVLTITAPLTHVLWANPHGAATIVWQKKNWDVVLPPIARMEARGLTREMLAPGKPITIKGNPRADGTPEIRVVRLTVDGKTVDLR